MNHSLNLFKSFKTDSLPFGRAHAKKYIRQFLLLFLIGIAANGIAESFSPGEEIHNTMSFIANMFSLFISIVLAVVSLRIYLDVSTGKPVNFNHFKLNTKAKRRTIGKWIRGYLLYAVIVMGGVGVFIIPLIWGYGSTITIGAIGITVFSIIGIYFAIRLSFREYFLVDQKMNINESLRASWDKTKGHEWQLLGVGFLSLGVFILGALALGIGLLWAAPTVKIAYAHLYRKLATT